MRILLGLFLLAAGIFALVTLLSGRKTKLFRRVWSAERVGGEYGHAKQREAVERLLEEFDVDFRTDHETIKAGLGRLFADATEFDVRNRRNSGIQVMPTLARRLSAHPALQDKSDIVSDLQAMASVDGIALHDALKHSLPHGS